MKPIKRCSGRAVLDITGRRPTYGRPDHENDSIEMQWGGRGGTIDRVVGVDILGVARPGSVSVRSPSPLEWGREGFKTNRTLPSHLQGLMVERVRD